MKEISPNSFPGRMIPALDSLAHQLLDKKQYSRLLIVSDLLAMFSRGAWDQIEEDVQIQILDRAKQDFNIRAWDDWDWRADSAYSDVADLISKQCKIMER